jgi:predicted amidophosphoribosyltransferase
MAASTFGINVVSRSHAVVCRTCGSSARRVAEACPTCNAALADAGFAIVATADATAMRRRWTRPQLRRAPAA